MNVALLPLVPRGMGFRSRQFRLLKDRHIYDTVSVLTTDTVSPFFVTVSGKKKSEALFAGDQSLVKEANIFLVMGLQATVKDRTLTKAEWLTFFNKGFFNFTCTVPESVTIDEDRLAAIAMGPGLELFNTTSALDVAGVFGRQYVDRRSYLVGENKVIPGGRAVEFSLNWLESGGNGLASTAITTVILAGGEYEPGNAKS